MMVLPAGRSPSCASEESARISFRCVRSPDAPKMTRQEASGTRSCSRPSRSGFASIAGATPDMLRPPRSRIVCDSNRSAVGSTALRCALLRRLHLLRHLLHLSEDPHEVLAHDLVNIGLAVAAP